MTCLFTQRLPVAAGRHGGPPPVGCGSCNLRQNGLVDKIVPPNLCHFLLRVTHAREWPAFHVANIYAYSWNGKPGGVKVAIRHYRDDQRDMLRSSHNAWRYRSASPSKGVRGHNMFFAAGEELNCALKTMRTQAIDGETDIICSGWSELPAAWLLDTLRVSAYATAIALSRELDDAVELVAFSRDMKPAGKNCTDRDFSFIAATNIDDPAGSAGDAIHLAMARNFDSTWWNSQRGQVFPRAAQRLLKARIEPHPVDRFVEYWLVCEFIASQSRTADVSMRITNILAPYVGEASQKRSHLVYEALGLKHLQRVRNDIVHGDIDSVEPVDLAMLEAIAVELVNFEMGLPYRGNSLIDVAVRKLASL